MSKPLLPSYIEMMRAHVDEGGQLSHRNGLDLLAEVERLQKLDSADDEGGVDPTTTELLKPRGNNGVVNAEICFSALLLMGDVDVAEDRVATWSPDDLAIAYDWAMRRHLQASDNDDVIVPPRPAFIPRAKLSGF